MAKKERKYFTLEEARQILAEENKRISIALSLSKQCVEWIDAHCGGKALSAGRGNKIGRAGFIRRLIEAEIAKEQAKADLQKGKFPR